MSTSKPLYTSTRGGSIVCFRTSSGRIFRSCSASRCIYSSDLHAAKSLLDNLEGSKRLMPQNNEQFPAQRKTTLKWTSDGELSAVDMTRILDRITNPELTQCDLACNLDTPSPGKSNKRESVSLPISAWLP